jgi:uncharacterized membrane protein
MKQLLPAGLLLAVIACGDPATPPPTSTATPGDTARTPQPARAPSRQAYQGLYVFGNEVNTFRDCASGKVYWVEDETGHLTARYKRTVESLPFDHEAVYAEVEARLDPPGKIGYAAEYDGILHVLKIDTLARKNRFNKCVPFDFWLTGTEPFWDLQISEGENALFFRDIGVEKTAVFPYVKPTVKGDTWTYDARTDAGQTLRIVIKKEACSDGMSDLEYAYSADVQYGGTRYRGCAVKHGEPDPAGQR